MGEVIIFCDKCSSVCKLTIYTNIYGKEDDCHLELVYKCGNPECGETKNIKSDERPILFEYSNAKNNSEKIDRNKLLIMSESPLKPHIQMNCPSTSCDNDDIVIILFPEKMERYYVCSKCKTIFQQKK